MKCKKRNCNETHVCRCYSFGNDSNQKCVHKKGNFLYPCEPGCCPGGCPGQCDDTDPQPPFAEAGNLFYVSKDSTLTIKFLSVVAVILIALVVASTLSLFKK